MKTRLAASLSAIGLFFAYDAHAAGFAVDVHAGRATGMASAVTGFIDDSSAVFYNPAGIAQGKVFDAQIGDTAILPSFKYTSESGKSTSTAFDIIPPFNAYASGGITDDLSIGVGVFTPYGLRVKWPDGWDGRRQITEAELASYYINPTVAYRIGPVRIGAGFQIVRSVVHLQRAIAFGSQEGSTDLGAAAWGFGGNFGVQVDAVPKVLQFGVHYRSAVKTSFAGKAHFENVPLALQQTIHDQNVETSLINPDTLAMGVAVRPIEALILDLDVVWYGWGKFRSIDLEFPDDRTRSLNSSRIKNWKSGVNVHLGGEAKVADAWRVRAGALYDPSPAPEDTVGPDIPDADRLNLALGGSWHHASGFHIDLGYQFIILFTKKSTSPEFPGEYGGFVNLLGLSLGYSTPRLP
jgi:long-chain fatty acid transport protein